MVCDPIFFFYFFLYTEFGHLPLELCHFFQCYDTETYILLFLFPIVQTGSLPYGGTPLGKCSTMTMSWSVEASGDSTLATARQKD